MSERDQAEQLTRFLLERDRYSSASPLEAYVEVEIKAMAKRIAGEVVKENPDLDRMIRERTQRVIRAALDQDSYLNKIVTESVAQALSQMALERREEDG